MKKTIITITVLCIIFTSFLSTVYGQNISSSPPVVLQMFENKTIDKPVILDNILYLPFRAVGQGLGYQVKWYSASKTMEISKEESILKATVAYNYGYVNRKKVELETPPIMYKGRAYVPFSFIADNVDYKVEYLEESNLVNISEKEEVSNINNEEDIVKQEDSIYYNDVLLNAKSPTTKYNKIFVPVRAVTEALGYEITWYSTINTMKLEKEDEKIVLTIRSNFAKINNERIRLDSPAYLEDGSALVSIGFIKDILGYDINCNKELNTVLIFDKEVKSSKEDKTISNKILNIEDVVYDESGGFPNLKIIANSEFEYSSFTLSNPDRFVIDIENALLKTSFTSKEINKGGISKVRIAQNSMEPQKIVRVVVDLESQKQCKLIQAKDKKSISLIYANIIKPVLVEKKGDTDVITLVGTSNLDATIIRLQDPDRLVIDINRAVHDEEEQTIDVSSHLLECVRTGQFSEGTARVVLDLKENIFYRIQNEINTTKIFVSEIPFEFFQYKKYYNSAFLDISPGEELEYQASIDEENNLFKISIPKDVEVNLNKYYINDNIIEYVEIKKETHGGKVYTIAECKMKDLVGYELISPALTKLVKVRFKYNAESFEQLTVVIDPGHGGKDPGAIAIDGTTEKSLNLDVSMRLKEKLNAIGFNTIVTRTNDTYVDLATRADIGNNSFADFFMSIHFNAFNSTTKGIETLYFPNEVSEEKPIDNRKIANIFHKELLSALDMPSRGITPRPNLYVLNKTKMPAILAELGFITNPEELKRIKTNEYRETAAKALTAAIVTYFKDVEGIELNFDVNTIYSDTAIGTVKSEKIANK